MTGSKTFVLLNEEFRTNLYDYLSDLPIDGTIEVTVERKPAVRTLTQNKSLHLYCDQVAYDMNEAGIGQRQLFNLMKPGYDVPVTMNSIKEHFRNVGFAMFDAESTSDLKTDEIHQVWQVVDERIMDLTKVSRPWPSIESMDYEARGMVR